MRHLIARASPEEEIPKATRCGLSFEGDFPLAKASDGNEAAWDPKQREAGDFLNWDLRRLLEEHRRTSTGEWVPVEKRILPEDVLTRLDAWDLCRACALADAARGAGAKHPLVSATTT